VPAEPSNTCGPDPTPDDLGCELTASCETGVITVRGRSFRGEAFFFCVQRSASMSWPWQGRVKLEYAKEWVIEAIQALDDHMKFSIVMFDGGMIIFSEEPVRATQGAKERGIAWVKGIPNGHDTCLAPAGVKTLSIAARSPSGRSRVFIISDGIPTCNGFFTQAQCLRDITAANVRKIPIDTVLVPDDGTWEDPDFLKQLAALNGGDSFPVVP